MKLSQHDITEGLARLEAGFMTPDVQGPMTVLEYEDTDGSTVYLPSDYADLVPSGADVTTHEGKYLARLSASGYMDQTDTTMHDTYDDAIAYLVDTYDDTF